MNSLPRLFLLLVFGATAASALSAPAGVTFDRFDYTGRDAIFDSPVPAGHYRNPILAGFYPDPSICRVGDDYYLINSSFAYFPGLPVFHSRDLVNWKQMGNVIARPSQLDYDGLGVTRGLFAPALSQHGGTFYVVCTFVDKGGNFLMTATDPAGPWSDPVWLDFDGIDPSLFFDDDGRAWLVNNGNPPDNQPLYQGHRAIWLQEFDVAAKKLIGPRSIIVNGGTDLSKHPVWIEGPHLYKRNGWYYLCCAEGGTSDQHSQVVFRSKSVTGPFVPWDRNPILTQRDLDGTVPHAVTSTGHADLVVGPDGNWWATFLACRPFAGHFTTTGRETFLLPVTWTDDGWPLILPPGRRVPYVVASPDGVSVDPSPVAPLTGNFTWTDNFDAPALSSQWIMLRQPRETWWSLSAHPGRLTLTPRAEALAGKGNPSFLARRVQHARFEAATTLSVPAESGVSAGLVAFQSETHYYYLGVRRTAGEVNLFLECRNGGAPDIVATATLPNSKQIELRLTGKDQALAFSYATEPGKWQTLVSHADTLPITVQAAGGGLHFTGAVVGPYARLDPIPPAPAGL
jgi:alpha-N-arabinofuranosidase